MIDSMIASTMTVTGPSRAAALPHRRSPGRLAALMGLALVLAGVLGMSPGGGLGVEEASARHGYAKTIKGVAVAQATVCAVNDYNQVVSCVLTNGYGQFALVVTSGHSYYLYVWQRDGCNVYYGSTGWFWIGRYTDSPWYYPKRLYPGTFWYRAC